MESTTAAGNGVKLNFSTDWKYAPAPEPAKVAIKPRYDLFIDGQFAAPAKGDYFDTTNPANEKKIAEVASATAEDVNRAVDATKSRGGQIVNGPMEVPGGDWIAQGIDPQGGMFAVHAKKK